MPARPDALVHALLGQLNETEFWPPQQLWRAQARQLGLLLQHAHGTTTHYRRTLNEVLKKAASDGLTPALFRRIPLLERETIQQQPRALTSNRVPASHQPVSEAVTSGSTAAPLTTLQTLTTRIWFKTMTTRNFLRHGFVPSNSVAGIQTYADGVALDKDGVAGRGWMPGFGSGPSRGLSIRKPIAEQIDWLLRQRPDYLLSFPSNLEAMADYVAAHGVDVSFLKAITPIGETLRVEAREHCERVFGCPLIDVYSAVELGVMACESPDDGQYLVCAETHYLEVLNAADEPCAPGEVGRVVVTPLHNFAMPMIRYANGDYAEVGQPCSAGRGLPTLARVVGRERNMLVLPGGDRRWFSVNARNMADHFPLVRAQTIQRSLDHLEVSIVLHGEVPPDAEARCRADMLDRLPRDFRIDFRYVDELPLGAGGKFEDFITEVKL